MTIPSPDITNHVPFCGPCLFLRGSETDPVCLFLRQTLSAPKSQRVREILNLLKGVRGKKQGEKKKLEGETEHLPIPAFIHTQK